MYINIYIFISLYANEIEADEFSTIVSQVLDIPPPASSSSSPNKTVSDYDSIIPSFPPFK